MNESNHSSSRRWSCRSVCPTESDGRWSFWAGRADVLPSVCVAAEFRVLVGVWRTSGRTALVSPSSREEPSATAELPDGRRWRIAAASDRVSSRTLLAVRAAAVSALWRLPLDVVDRVPVRDATPLTPSDEPPLRPRSLTRSNGRSSVLFVNGRRFQNKYARLPVHVHLHFSLLQLFPFFWAILLPLNYCTLRTFLVCCVLTRDIFSCSCWMDCLTCLTSRIVCLI